MGNSLIKERDRERDWGGKGKREGWRKAGKEGPRSLEAKSCSWLIYLFDLLDIFFLFPFSFLPLLNPFIHPFYWVGQKVRSGFSITSYFVLTDQAQDQVLRKLHVFSFRFVLPFGEASPPSGLLPADILADFCQRPHGLDGGCPRFRESVSNASAASDNLKRIPCTFLFQGPCSLESSFLPKRHPSCPQSIYKKPGGARHSPSHQLLTLL